MSQTEHIVTPDDNDIRLDRWFKRHYPAVQHSMLEKHLRKGMIRLDGKKAKTSDRVMSGQVVRCPDLTLADLPDMPKPKRTVSEEELEQIRKWVLYKDANIIIINKPYGLAVQGGSKITRCVDDMLDGLIFDAGQRPKLTHRLDRDTSGALVLARDTRSATALMKLFSSRKIEKTYWALVNGSPLPMNGTIDLPILKKENPKASGRAGGPEGRDYEIMQVDQEGGQKSITEYRTLDFLARKFALMELNPLTGRTHQLRVHMQAIGCPIVGDHKYGGSMGSFGNSDAGSVGVENILHLHARRIVIPAIAGGKPIDITAPLPEHMVNSFRALGLDVPKK